MEPNILDMFSKVLNDNFYEFCCCANQNFMNVYIILKPYTVKIISAIYILKLWICS